MSPQFHFLVPSLDVEFYVVRFSGTEGLGQLFCFRIALVCKNASLDLQEILDEPAVFSISRENAVPVQFPGVVASIEQGACFNDWYYYTVELRPNFWLLSQWKKSEIFLDKNVQEITEEIFKENPTLFIAPQFRLLHSYPQREFVMQYEETPYDFILWNLEQAGIYYYFSEKGNSLIFADSPQSHDQASITVSYSPISNLEGDKQKELITSFVLKQNSLPRQVIVRSYNWKEPSKIIVGKAEVFAKGKGEVLLADEDVANEEEANKLAGIRAQEILCSQRCFLGKSAVPLFRPGVVFHLEKHFNKSFNRDYLITEIKHEGAQEDFLSLELGIPVDGVLDHLFYRNSFSCIEANVVFRPQRQAKRAKIAGVLHAFIDGAGSGARAEMDEYGRYKVLFPFDLSGRKNGNASCWIRKAQQQVGKDSGLSFPLLPGTEVIVSFINSNPDRPVITGALANGETGTISGCGNVNISGIRTAGGNQITFNDTDTKQGLALQDARGHGIIMTAGSSDQLNITTDKKLEATVVGSTELASLSKSAISGFRNTTSVFASKSLPAFFGFIASSLCSSAKKTMDALGDTNAATKATGEALSWASDIGKIAENLVFLLIPKGSKDYGFTVSTSSEKTMSCLQVKPDKAQLLTYMIPFLTMSVISKGVEFAKNVIDTKNVFASIKDIIKECMDELYKYDKLKYSDLSKEKAFYTYALQHSCGYYQIVYEYLSLLIKDLNVEKNKEENNYTSLSSEISNMIKDMYTKEDKVHYLKIAMSYLYNKDKKTYIKYDPEGNYYKSADTDTDKKCEEVAEALNIFQGKKLEEKTQKTKKINSNLTKFSALQNKLNNIYKAECLKQAEGTGYSAYDKSAAVRKVTTSTVQSLIAELTSIITLVVWSSQIESKVLGGVNLVSDDSNINLSAQKMVSLHSKDGVFLDTKTETVKEMGKWGLPTGNEIAVLGGGIPHVEREWNKKVLDPVKDWTLRSKQDERAGQNWVKATAKLNVLQTQDNTLVATHTDIDYLQAKWRLEKVDYDLHSQANNYLWDTGETKLSLEKKGIDLSSSGYITCNSLAGNGEKFAALEIDSSLPTEQASLMSWNSQGASAALLLHGNSGSLEIQQGATSSKLVISPDGTCIKLSDAISATFSRDGFKLASNKVEIGKMVVEGNKISSSAPGGVLDFGGCIKVTGANGSGLQLDSKFNGVISKLQDDVKALKDRAAQHEDDFK